MNQEDELKIAKELLQDIHNIHWGREAVRKLLSKKENDSYSIIMDKIHKFLSGDTKEERRDIYGG